MYIGYVFLSKIVAWMSNLLLEMPENQLQSFKRVFIILCCWLLTFVQLHVSRTKNNLEIFAESIF